MRAVVQRVSSARVLVDGDTVGAIGRGVVVLLGIAPEDADPEVSWAADKIAHLRIFNDADGKMNLSLLEVGGEALLVSQFTLYGDARRGRRPSFVKAAQGPEAERIYEKVKEALSGLGIKTATGRFGAMMKIELTNEGPTTILLDSNKTF
ncbi:MAG: D-aminoacyl-tRNA deacylase [Actinomycetota bacterium]|nr:D-tyrosyl-tRNA(Tyr) deacylase [Actinomycetota bacterium]